MSLSAAEKLATKIAPKVGTVDKAQVIQHPATADIATALLPALRSSNDRFNVQKFLDAATG